MPSGRVCTQCGGKMLPVRRSRERRGAGPLGNYYVIHWRCWTCHHQVFPRVTKREYNGVTRIYSEE